jgi:3-deoxy-D-manno-octulosonic-acid transferase
LLLEWMPDMPWLLNLAYILILLLAAPVLLYRRIVHGKYRDGWAEKFLGRLPIPAGSHPRVWFHAVSVGEVLQLESLVADLIRQRPELDVVISATTSTGLAVAKDKFPHCHVCYFPLDFSWAVRNAVKRIRPDAVVLVELELWPNFIREVRRRGIPLVLVNGRISEKSFRGYRKLRFLMRPVLECFQNLAVQSGTYADRLRQLGAPPERITVTGSIKFDGVQTQRNNPRTQELRRVLGIGESERVFVAGSTHAPEEEFALNVWQELRSEYPDLRLVLVPRHKERFEDVARLVESRGLSLLRRSAAMRKAEDGNRWSEVGGPNRICSKDAQSIPPGPVPGTQYSVPSTQYSARRMDSSQHSNTPLLHLSKIEPHPNALTRSPPHPLTPSPILLLDTLGELSACWGLADVAFVGGSLTPRGGQNMIEPAAYGAVVLFGPNTRNFREVVELLLEGNAARMVRGESDLNAAMRDLLRQADVAERLGRNARRLVLAQQGATGRTAAIILPFLPSESITVTHRKPAA